MNSTRGQEKVGILPVGALGVGFFFHLTQAMTEQDGRVCFVERSGSPGGRNRNASGALSIATEKGMTSLPVTRVCRPGLLACAGAGWVPDIVLVCTGSDQVLPVITNFVELLQNLYIEHGLDLAVEKAPVIILCSNGIYFQRVRQFLVESLEESTLYGRLPDLWTEPMGRIVGKLMRGVTIQTGTREGDGPGAIYRPGPLGRTRLAGGDPALRRKCGEILQQLGGWFEVEEVHTPTRAEFDKALINLFGNLLGQFKAIDEQGAFRLVTVRDIFPQSENQETRELAHHVIAVGRAVHAYGPKDEFETLYRGALAATQGLMDHVPSSIKWIEAQLQAETLQPKITPTEKWLLEPLIRYASSAGLEESTHYFTDLVQRIEQRLALAINAHARNSPAPPAEVPLTLSV